MSHKDLPNLSERHYQMLVEQSGISEKVVRARGYRTVSKKRDLTQVYGFSEAQARVAENGDVLVVPMFGVHGGDQPVLYHMRPDVPRYDATRERMRKYEFPAKCEMHIDVPRPVFEHIRNPSIPLWITEGSKKADKAVSHGLTCVGLPGVWNWLGKNKFGGYTDLADWESIALKGVDGGRDVYVVFDSDVMTKLPVWRSLNRLVPYLKNRGGRVHLVYLPDGEDGSKQGLDDFLVAAEKSGRTADEAIFELKGLATRTLRAAPKDEKEADDAEYDPYAPYKEMYEQTPAGLFLRQQSRDGVVLRQVATYNDRILAMIVRDDGAEETLYVDVEAWCNGKRRVRFLTSLKEYREGDWQSQNLGLGAAVMPGRGNREHAWFGPTMLCQPIETRRMYAHLGWLEQEPEGKRRWVYLHSRGAIGAGGEVSDITVDGSNLGDYHFPPLPDDQTDEGRQKMAEAVRTSLRFLDVAPLMQTLPLLASAYTAPLATFIPCDFALWIQGESGSKKSTAAGIVMRHFGAFGRTQFPASFLDTSNAVEAVAFLAKDALLVVDDYKPPLDQREARQMEAVALRLIGGVGDGQGRARLTKTSQLVRGKAPRCLPVVTSEKPVPGTRSREARTLRVDWEHEPDLDKLQHAEEQDSKLYGVAMAGFIRYLSRWMGERGQQAIKDELRGELLRIRGYMPGQHGRVRESASKLLIGFDLYLRFARELGVVTSDEYVEWYQRAARTLAQVADVTGKSQASRRGTELLRRYLGMALKMGVAYVCERTAGGRPRNDGDRWGWSILRGGEKTYRESAVRVGYLDENSGDLLIDPDPAVAVCQIMANRLEEPPFAENKTTLGKALITEAILLRHNTPRTTYYVRVMGSSKSDPFWPVRPDWLFSTDGEEGPDPSEETSEEEFGELAGTAAEQGAETP